MKKKILIGVLLINFGILGILLSKKEKIEQVYQEENIELAFYVENVKQDTIPSKGNEENFGFRRAICYTNGKEDPNITVTWNNSLWGPLIKGLTAYKTRCDLYFERLSAAEAILAKGETDELKYDGTADNNLRYVGAEPNNYVSFNNELWRIIGVMNNIDDGTGKKETRLKIIRDESIGSYSWDNKASGTGSSTSSNGSNDWSDSALQIVLNEGAYWNRTTGECPYGQKGATTTCDFSSTGLTEEAKAMIDNAKWNLGGSSTYNNVTASMFYERERGTTIYEGRPTEWTGEIGIMYPSDYGYATSKVSCLNEGLYNWAEFSVSSDICGNNDWLYNSSNTQWTLTSYSGNSNYVFYVTSLHGNITRNYASSSSCAVYPVLYLSSNVKIVSGNGSQSNPFKLSL